MTMEHAPEAVGGGQQVYLDAGIPMHSRDADEFARLAFTGLEMVPPGVVLVSEWRPDFSGPLPTPAEVSCYGGVARKPLCLASPRLASPRLGGGAVFAGRHGANRPRPQPAWQAGHGRYGYSASEELKIRVFVCLITFGVRQFTEARRPGRPQLRPPAAVADQIPAFPSRKRLETHTGPAVMAGVKGIKSGYFWI